ncbi:Cohesin subunit rad21 [Candida viswanathii]|uniref:Cohesin subunit rad21 n=1 Tax=Candida viswanathii TaxID=5486 RepID=A0A367YK25_9ASCO|nr:Cohesin subunit rad21 [Candida viswanathii]
MIPDSIISRDGPLGHVWLAANYEKKLSKHQLMNTNIVKSTEYIAHNPIITDVSVSQESSDSANDITLRLSGQLLLGIVRIYSRKTKYLLDDVNDILYKLKASFKLSSGVNLGSDNISNQVNLPPQQTILQNLNNIILKDQVTSANLLQQEDLDLSNLYGDSQQASLSGIFSQGAASQLSHQHDSDFDQSLEFPRYEDDAITPGPTDDFELDFDLNMDDDSIEVGRDAAPGVDDREMSVISDIGKERTMGNIFDIDFGQPVDSLNDEEETHVEHQDQQQTQEEQPLEVQPRRARQKRTRITEDGQIITNNRRLVVDSQDAMEGLPVQQLRDNQERLLQGQAASFITVHLSDAEKLKLIEELSLPVATKRRKLWNMDAELQFRCAELALQEEQEQENQQDDFEFDQGFDNHSMDFELDLPDFNDAPQDDDQLSMGEIPIAEDLSDDENSPSNTAKATEQIGKELVDLFKTSNTVEFGKLVETDSKIHEDSFDKLPLGVVNRNKDYINTKKEASKCFFELLVLATNDCISLEQEPQATDIAGDMTIRSRDRLFSQFI